MRFSLPQGTDWLVKPYRAVMRFLVKYHRWFGIITVLSVITHFILASRYEGIPVTGIAAGALMLILFGLGIYGFLSVKIARGFG